MNDVDLMARTAWGEARNQGERGMQAICNVIMNRADNPTWWGHNVKEVCLKPYQFSCWLPSDPNFAKLKAVGLEDKQYAQAYELAQLALYGGLEDLTGGATSYFAKTMEHPPKWAEDREPCAMIGDHLFYKDVG